MADIEYREIARVAGSIRSWLYLSQGGTSAVWRVLEGSRVNPVGDLLPPHVARYELAKLLTDAEFSDVFGRAPSDAEPGARIIDGLRYDTTRCALVCRYRESEDIYEPDVKRFKKYGRDTKETYGELLRTPGGRWCVTTWTKFGRTSSWSDAWLRPITDDAAQSLLERQAPDQALKYFSDTIADA